MIELRHLDKEIPTERVQPMTNVAHGRPRETVWQYRWREYRTVAGDANSVTAAIGEWSDWQDVKTVKEGEGEKA